MKKIVFQFILSNQEQQIVPKFDINRNSKTTFYYGFIFSKLENPGEQL